MYNAVGIDVSKGKSTVTVLQPGGTVIHKPFVDSHSPQSLHDLAEYLTSLDGDTRIVMECTGRYHEPILKFLSDAGLFVSAVNPHLIKNFGNNSLRKVKSDPQTPERSLAIPLTTGRNYAYSFWHVDCVRGIGLKAFTERYRAFCKRHHYNFQADKPEKLFHAPKELVAVFPKEKTYKLLIQQSIQQLNLISEHVEQLRRKMNELASTLPEYNTVMGIYGVGKTYGPQLIAEIGDVSRFTHREALTDFAGVDPSMDESSQRRSKSNRASKVGSARLRKTLFQIMTTLLQNAPEDDPVYRFLDKKPSQGKPYYVYMTAGANKFFRIYYGKVKECLRNLERES